MEKDNKLHRILPLLTNKKGFHDYEVLKEYECGIKLDGAEVKSIREKHFNLKSSFVTIRENELFIQKMHISQYKMLTNSTIYDTERERKLLLHKRDISNLLQKIKEKGFTIIPTEVYFKGNLIKIKIALAKGKKLFEKKETLKKRDIEMDLRRSLSERK